MRAIYVAPHLKRIREKLDSYWMDTWKRCAISFSWNGTYTVNDELARKAMPIRSVNDLSEEARKHASPEALERFEKRLSELRQKEERQGTSDNLVTFNETGE